MRRDEMDRSLRPGIGEVSERLLEVAYKNRVWPWPGACTSIWAIVHRDDPDAVLPDGADLSLLPQETERADRASSNWRSLDREARCLGDGSPLALLRTCQSRLKIEPIDDFWEGGEAPAWADDWGRDEFGPWVDLRVRRRQAAPPLDSSGKVLDGVARTMKRGDIPTKGHGMRKPLRQGFWMFDTPCTQALWEAVMGENPSYFKGPDRPVERVSWDRCQEFLKRLNERCKGLELRLPIGGAMGVRLPRGNGRRRVIARI